MCPLSLRSSKSSPRAEGEKPTHAYRSNTLCETFRSGSAIVGYKYGTKTQRHNDALCLSQVLMRVSNSGSNAISQVKDPASFMRQID